MKHCIDCHTPYRGGARKDTFKSQGRGELLNCKRGKQAVRSKTDKGCFTEWNPTPSSFLLTVFTETLPLKLRHQRCKWRKNGEVGKIKRGSGELERRQAFPLLTTPYSLLTAFAVTARRLA